MLSLLAWGAPAVPRVVSASGPRPVLVEREMYLMGTRVRLAVWASDRGAGLAELEEMAATLEGAEAELSTWRSDTPLARINAAGVGEPLQLEPSLCATFRAVAPWVASTDGAFDPAVGQMLGAWGVRTGGRLPAAEEVHAAAWRSGWGHLGFDAARCAVRKQREVIVDEGGFGKGDALDRVERQRAQSGRSGPWLIDLGGQVMVGGHPPGVHAWTIDVASPTNRELAMATLQLDGGSVSVSGGSERDTEVSGRRVGHILDPRTGRPAPFAGVVIAWHRRALVADVVSTAVYVMGRDAGLAWADARGLHVCIVDADESGGAVRISATTAFRRKFAWPRGR